jgi:hypothetical protein
LTLLPRLSSLLLRFSIKFRDWFNISA